MIDIVRGRLVEMKFALRKVGQELGYGLQALIHSEIRPRELAQRLNGVDGTVAAEIYDDLCKRYGSSTTLEAEMAACEVVVRDKNKEEKKKPGWFLDDYSERDC